MKKLKYDDISVGDWIYWVDYSDGKVYFVTNIKRINKKEMVEDWWKLNHTLKKFNKFIKSNTNGRFEHEDFKGYDITRKMTKAEIEQFKVKLVADKL